jgi:lysophospholipase L1-like esterase
MNPQPKIIPIVMANFDKLPNETNYKCQIMPSFKMSDYGIDNDKDQNLSAVVKGIEKQYKNWIKKIVLDKGDFTREISVLQRRANHKKNTSDLLVFYGSSTIRLWNSLANDFPQHNTLNLGFGGAFIHSLSTHFDALFNGLQPKAIFLYLGGNDLSLYPSAKEIVNQITAFMNRVYQKFPQVMVYNISIKPSYERQKDLPMIKEINAAMEKLAKTTPQLQQLNLFDQLVQQGEIRKDVLLQDGLHLNANGDKILKGLVHKALLEKYS